MIPPPVEAGQPIRAETINAMLAELRVLANTRGGQGIHVRRGVGGLLFSLVADRRLWIPAYVTHNGGHAPPPNAVYASVVRYTVQAKDRTGEWADLTPYWGRPVEGDEVKIYPAPIGKRCWIARLVGENGEIEVLPWIEERVARKQCTPPPPPGGLRTIDVFADEPGGAGAGGGGGGGRGDPGVGGPGPGGGGGSDGA